MVNSGNFANSGQSLPYLRLPVSNLANFGHYGIIDIIDSLANSGHFKARH